MTDGAQDSSKGTYSPGRWGVVLVLSVIAACLLVQVGVGTGAAPVAGGAGGDVIFAVAGQVTRDTYGLYLVNVKTRTICLYQYVPTSHKLHLRAARNVNFDLRLDAYNTEPLPQQIQKLVEEHRRLKVEPEG